MNPGQSPKPLPPDVEWVFIDARSPLYQGELDLRFRVLRQPLGHPRSAVKFAFEEESLHLVALRAGAVVGCVLFHPESAQTGRLFQMAVEPQLQGQGVGARLVRRLEDEVRSRGFQEVTLHARQSAAAFYSRLGYAPYGEPFTEVGIPHLHMRRAIGTPGKP